MKCNFSVGDLVIGTKESDGRYSITNSRVICKVVSVGSGNTISLTPVKEKSGRDIKSSSAYEVNSKYFEPLNKYAVNLI